MYLSLECLYFVFHRARLLTAMLISFLKVTLQTEGLKNTAQGRRPSIPEKRNKIAEVISREIEGTLSRNMATKKSVPGL